MVPWLRRDIENLCRRCAAHSIRSVAAGPALVLSKAGTCALLAILFAWLYQRSGGSLSPRQPQLLRADQAAVMWDHRESEATGIPMLLRRLTEHLRSQNWTAVWIDLLIVILGVFIGIQVTNWNEARLTRDSERAILAALRQEFLSFERDVEGMITSQLQLTYNYSVVAETLDGDQPPRDADAFEFALYSIPYGAPPPSSSGVLQELVVSGRLSELSDPELRRELAAYIAKRDLTYDNILRVNTMLSSLGLQTEIPYVAEIAPSQRIAAILESPDAGSFEHANTLGFSNGAVVSVRSYDLAAMRSDPSIRHAFVTAYDANLAKSSWLRTLAADTRELSNRLGLAEQ